MSGAAELIPLCNSGDLADGGIAVPFDVMLGGQTCRAFAIRFEGRAHAYLNRCSHIAMELDWQPGAFFDMHGRDLICSTHGAIYSASSGNCLGGPCAGRPLVKLVVEESDGVIVLKDASNG